MGKPTIAAVLVALNTAVTAAPAEPTPSAVMSQNDVEFLYALSLRMPSAQYALVYIATECHVPPTQAVFDAIKRSATWNQALTAFEQRLMQQQRDTVVPKVSLTSTEFPQVTRLFCKAIPASIAEP